MYVEGTGQRVDLVFQETKNGGITHTLQSSGRTEGS